MNASEVHLDVASYALGVLDAADVERFEEHLVTCDACALELEALLPVTRLLADVDRDAFQKTSQSVGDGMMFDRMRNVVAFERKRSKVRTTFLVAAAAAVAVIATLAISIGFLGTNGAGGGSSGTNPNAVGGRATVGAPQNTEPGSGDKTPGFNGTPTGTQFSATDALSGAKMNVSVASQPWGSELAVTLSKVTGPLTCSLLIVGRDGHSEQAGTWVVSRDGYGTTAHPDPLKFAAPTSMQASAIDRIEVRANNGSGASTLVSVKL
jgi:hypothetical protein